jgi:hypothetical protein
LSVPLLENGLSLRKDSEEHHRIALAATKKARAGPAVDARSAKPCILLSISKRANVAAAALAR